MNDIKIRISNFLQTHKFIIGFAVIAIILFVLVIRVMGKYTRVDSNQINISESVFENVNTVSTTKDIINNNEINNYADVEKK